MATSILRQSPIDQGASKTESHLVQPSYGVKFGVKGPALAFWLQQQGIDLPANLYDVLALGEQSLLARVGSEEVIIECPEHDALLSKIEQSSLRPMPGVYRIEQQTVTFDLKGDLALRVFAQTCGVNLELQPTGRIFFTRVAGVSSAIIVRDSAQERIYRLWVDYTLAPYLWEVFSDIIRQI